MKALQWLPVLILGCGSLLAAGVRPQSVLPLQKPLTAAVPRTLQGVSDQDLVLSQEERNAVGVTNYLWRTYAGGPIPYTLYVGYYDQQTRGRTIHSPKNCLPGAGWEPVANSTANVAIGSGTITVNRYLLKRGAQTALVLYWYQGRGRVAHNEYLVKWDLLRDAAVQGRSEEALVRVMLPVTGTEDEAMDHAAAIVRELVPAIYEALPG